MSVCCPVFSWMDLGDLAEKLLSHIQFVDVNLKGGRRFVWCVHVYAQAGIAKK